MRHLKEDDYWVITLIAIVLIALLFTAETDLRSDQNRDLEYCQHVSSGEWPDYKEQFKELCSGPMLREK